MQDIASEIVLNKGAKEGTKIRAALFAGHRYLKLEGHVMLLFKLRSVVISSEAQV
jgi:hypothetical protein